MVITGQYRSGVAIETAIHDGIGSDPIYAIYQIAQPSVLPFLHPFAMSCHVLPECGLVFELSSPHVRWTSAMRLKSASPRFRLMSHLFWHLKLPEVTWQYGDWLNHVKPNDAALGVILCSFDMNHRVPGCTFPSCSVYHGIQPRVGHTSACALQRFQKWEADAAWLPLGTCLVTV